MDPVRRFIAIFPVILIAGAVVAFMWGIRPEGRQYTTAAWRTHTVAEQGFSVAVPGVVTVTRQTMYFDGEDRPVPTYVASDQGADFSIAIVRRPDSDDRPFADVAEDLGVSGENPMQRPGGLTAFAHDVILDNKRTRALLIFHDGMMYQLMVVAPTKTFPEQNADRFFASFRRVSGT